MFDLSVSLVATSQPDRTVRFDAKTLTLTLSNAVNPAQTLEELMEDWGITDRATAVAFLNSRSRQLRQQNRGLLRQKLQVSVRGWMYGIARSQQLRSSNQRRFCNAMLVGIVSSTPRRKTRLRFARIFPPQEL